MTMTGWGLFRDGYFFRAFRLKKDAVEKAKQYRPGSKHKWTVKPVSIIEH